MDLKDFVRDTLLQLAEGVREAQTQAEERKWTTLIAPARSATGRIQQPVEMVKFDVAVTVSDTDQKSGKAGIRVFSFGEIGGSAEREASRSEVHRIKFEIPIEFQKQYHAPR